MSYHAPIDFQKSMLSDYFNVQPSVVKGQANRDTAVIKRQLYNYIYSCFDFKIPNHWDINWFRYWLFHYGSILVIYTKEYGWVCQPYSVLELNLMYNPLKVLVYNSFIQNEKIGIVGINCEIVHPFDDYFGYHDIVAKYAGKLAQCDRALDVQLMNSNVTLVAKVPNKKVAESVKLAYEKSTQGEPLVVVNEDILSENGFEPIFPGLKNNFIGLEIVELRRAIMADFLTHIGIPNVPYEKKERLVTEEVSQGSMETEAFISIALKNLKEQFEVINRISGLDLHVKYNYDAIERMREIAEALPDTISEGEESKSPRVKESKSPRFKESKSPSVKGGGR